MSSEKYNKSLELDNLAKNLKKIKASKEFGNFKKMARLLKISDQHLSDIVRKHREPSDRLIDAMAVAFKVPREKLLSDEGFPIAAEDAGQWSADPRRRQLLEKVKKFVEVADDGAVTALLNNVDEFQKGADARLELERLLKANRNPRNPGDDDPKSKLAEDPTDPTKWELEPGAKG